MDIRWTRLVLAACALCAGVAHAQTVTPPPLPIGSAMARPDPGMAEPERKRHVRAHHHKFHHGKDYTRDDSVHGHESLAAEARPVGTRAAGSAGAGAAPAAAAGRGGSAPVTGGAGTGPGREKTDRGASSYFFGNDKK